MIRTRIAPSPTGEDIHIGNLYTALINWVFAKKNHGKFVVRIEDTDRIRLIEGAEKRILQSLEDYGIVPDESSIVGGAHGPYRQSERLPIYKKYAEELVESGKAYYCFCSKERLDMLRAQAQEKKQISKYDKYCFKNVKLEDAKERIKKGEKYVIRMHIPEGTEIAFDDLIRGTITFHSKDIDDQILLKSDGYPTYHLAVVVDDHLMEISHVIRAEEWISSTPKHIFLYNAFGWELPVFAHVPILRNPNRSKLSKRKNPVWASWYLDQGFLPEAVLNYLALMGWSHPKQKEIFSMEEFIREFELKDVSAVGPAFDVVKLEWMNGEYLRKLRIENLELRIQNYVGRDYDRTIITKTIPLIQERIKKLPKGYATKLPSGKIYGEALLTKTNIYAKLIQNLFKEKINLHYISNITGHGTRKIMRAKGNFTYVVERIIEPQEIFHFIKKHANLTDYDMYETYNMGMDYALLIPPKNVAKTKKIIKKCGFDGIDAGYVEKGKRQVIIKPKNLVYKAETLDLR